MLNFKVVLEGFDEVVEFEDIMIEHSDVSTGLVGHMDLMALLDQFLHCASHADDIIIRVRGEYQHFLLFRGTGVVGYFVLQGLYYKLV